MYCDRVGLPLFHLSRKHGGKVGGARTEDDSVGAETRAAGFYGDVEEFLLFPEDLEAVHALEGMAAVRFEHLAQDGVPSPLWVVNKVGRVKREAPEEAPFP